MERKPIRKSVIDFVPDLIPDEKGQVRIGGWGLIGGEGTGVHVIQGGKFACTGDTHPKTEPVQYAYLTKDALNPRIRVYCESCNDMLEKFSEGTRVHDDT